MENRELHLRVAKNGSVNFVHEELSEVSKINNSMQRRSGDTYPSSATNYASHIASETRSSRTQGHVEDKKAYVSPV